MDACQWKHFLCHWGMNRDSWLYLARECSVCRELNFADDLSGSEVPLLHFGDYIKSLCCKTSGSVTAWLNSLPSFFSFFLLFFTFLSLCAVISVRTRFREFQGKPSGELWRSRTCKWHFTQYFLWTSVTCVLCMHALVCICTHICHLLFSVFANAQNPHVPVHQYFIVLNVMSLLLAVLIGNAAH